MPHTLPPPDAREPVPLLDLKGLSRLLGRSRESLHRDVKTGRVPRPLKIGRSTRWRRADIEAWIDGGCMTTCPVPNRRPATQGAHS